MARHPTVSTSTPPTNGPRPNESPTTAPQTPTARARFTLSVNVVVTIERATGFSIEPPTACSIRAAISQPTLGARLQSSDPVVKMIRPSWKMRRRPNRSPNDPDSTSRLARTSV